MIVLDVCRRCRSEKHCTSRANKCNQAMTGLEIQSAINGEAKHSLPCMQHLWSSPRLYKLIPSCLLCVCGLQTSALFHRCRLVLAHLNSSRATVTRPAKLFLAWRRAHDWLTPCIAPRASQRATVWGSADLAYGDGQQIMTPAAKRISQWSLLTPPLPNNIAWQRTGQES